MAYKYLTLTHLRDPTPTSSASSSSTTKKTDTKAASTPIHIFIITLQKAPENRITTAFAQEIIRAFREVESTVQNENDALKGNNGIGVGAAVITTGEGAKFWSTVRLRGYIWGWADGILNEWCR